MEAVKAAGAKRAKALPISIAAHSPLMDSIQKDWDAAVDACTIETPVVPVVGNVHAKQMLTADELRADIKAQMQSRVRWTESVQEMRRNGVETFIEAGSGTVLLGLIKRIDASAPGWALGAPQDFAALNQ
jgi:[acyl-carrier-protein] S-malonyltransferase